jgi:opacity protein-like surface antigen
MKHFLKSLFTIAFAFAAFMVSAQVQISVGPRVGVNLAKWSVDGEVEEEIGDISNRTGFVAGAVAEFRFNDNFAVQPEINFLQKGFKSEFAISDSILGDFSSETNVVMNYLEVPVLAKVGKSFGTTRVDLLAGPSFGYAMNGKVKSKFTIGGNTEEGEEDIDFEEDEISRFDLGLQVGAAVTFNLGSANLFIDGRYALGFSNLNDSPDDEESNAYNRGIVLSAGVLFPL